MLRLLPLELGECSKGSQLTSNLSCIKEKMVCLHNARLESLHAPQALPWVL
jgi:hypothetical protein